jgi:shikimate dehydrogenase
MRTFGLIGYPLKHSFSPQYFKNKFKEEGILNSEYCLFELDDVSKVVELVESVKPAGLNVTIPYKEMILPYLDELSPAAKKIGAVNTIKFNEDYGVGYNTDVYGFEISLKELYGENKPENALILGTGGAAKAVQYVLEELDIVYHNVSRRQGFMNYEDIDQKLIEVHTLIVNTTPLGTFPDINNAPKIPYKYLTDQHLLYDLVYNPDKSLFMKQGEAYGARVKNGLEMLQLQAEKAWEIWNQL